MKKRTKIVYIATIILNVILCGVDICKGNYIGAIMCGLTGVWMSVCYCLIDIIIQQDRLIDDYRNLLIEIMSRGNGNNR